MQAKQLNPLKIALTGGGTAGHVMPHLALLQDFQKRQWRYFYIGSRGMERDLIKPTGMDYYCVSSGKLRRYLSRENLIDIFRVGAGLFQSLLILAKERPDLVFSKGGFVSVPVCYAAFILGIPVITHESDLTPGLATRLIAKIAKYVLYAFEETGRYLPKGKGHWVGAILRQDLLTGDAVFGRHFAGFSEGDKRPVVLVMGGSLGAQRINDCLKLALPEILKTFRIIHITGKGKGIDFKGDGYFAVEFLGKELKDVFAATELVVARAGANSIFEFLALHKPMLLIPLEAGSRGDQLHNAKSFSSKGWAHLLKEADLTEHTLLSSLRELAADQGKVINAQLNTGPSHGLDQVLSVLSASLATK